MLLIDRLIADVGDRVTTETLVRPEMPFLLDEGLPSWVGIELMAQTMASWSGLRQWRSGQGPQLGFLVGTRKYECRKPFFPLGSLLRTDAELEIAADNGLAVFRCTIRVENETVASAQVSSYQPADVQTYLEDSK
jgi:predicted hotdog family 3-hydroxylacyl-ACP dehydratase